MGSKVGVIKVAAKRIGISFEEYIENINEDLKWCYKCKSWKHITLFGVDNSRTDGRSAVCKRCKRTNLNIPSRTKRKQMAALGYGWCCNCEKWFPSAEINNARCRDCRNEYERNRYIKDLNYREERKNHRDNRRRGVDRVPIIGQEILFEDTNGKCVYCGREADTWDHIVAVSKGGKTNPDNVVPCCVSCNSSKKDRDVIEWLDEKGYKPHPLLVSKIELSAMKNY